MLKGTTFALKNHVRVTCMSGSYSSSLRSIPIGKQLATAGAGLVGVFLNLPTETATY